MKKDTKNALNFFIKMVVIFIIIDVILNNITPLIVNIVGVGKFGRYIIAEAGAVALALITIFLSKNTYIFSEKKEGFIESIKVGGFMFCLAIMVLLTNIISLKGDVKLYDLLSIIIYCLLIGIFEEFLCRGFIQNEFIERFAKNRQQVIFSIVLSSLIFGGMHITNIWIAGQGVVETIVQVIQATGLGILLGAVYYRTKNIWSSVFLHAFWDFAVFIGQINIIKDCTPGNITAKYLLYMLISSILLTTIYILISIYILRKSKTHKIIEEYTEEEIKQSEANKPRLICIIIILYLSVCQIPVQEKDEICYEYETKAIVYNEIIYPEYNKYTITEENLNLELSITSKNELLIKDTTNNIEKKFTDNYIDSLMVIKNNNSYTIILRGLNDHQNDTVVFYSDFINTEVNGESYSPDQYLNEIIKSFSILESAPTTYKLGYIESKENNIKYPFLETVSEKMIIYENEIYILEKSTQEITISNKNNEENINSTDEQETPEVEEEPNINTPNDYIPENSLPLPGDIIPPKEEVEPENDQQDNQPSNTEV